MQMSRLLNLIGLSGEQLQAVNEISDILGISISNDGIPVKCCKKDRLEYGFDGQSGHIFYVSDHQFTRGLGVFCEKLKKQESFLVQEEAAYEDLGVMVDCSRNAVINMSAFKELIKHLALMGFSSIQPYTEDTYEIKEYPYFGYQRGRYTMDEFHEMDEYARLFSIEIVPCIQTLAHLGRILHWSAFSEVHDCNDILLADSEKTYELIDSMFSTMSKNLTSRRINIGMDEAHMLGRGKYLDRFGYKDSMEIMLRHTNRVIEIAHKYGYKPMMWSDMFFRLVSGGEYYTDGANISEELLKKIPENVSLVYWDYYSTDKKTYDKMLDTHKKMSSDLIFAGGAWKWTGLSPNQYFSEKVAKLAHNSCAEHGIKEVLITSWGDNGAECSLFSVLPVLQLWAELCYTNRADEEHLETRFFTCTAGSHRDFMHLGDATLTPDNPAPGRCSVNASKYLLYQDILGGLFDAHVLPGSFAEQYKNSMEFLTECGKRNPKWEYLFRVQSTLCNVLSLKSDMGLRIRNAYHSGDKKALKNIANVELPDLSERIEELLEAVEVQWDRENKIFGLDVMELRFGGLKQRINSATKRIIRYTGGDIGKLEELDDPVLFYDNREHDETNLSIGSPFWHDVVSANIVCGL